MKKHWILKLWNLKATYSESSERSIEITNVCIFKLESFMTIYESKSKQIEKQWVYDMKAIMLDLQKNTNGMSIKECKQCI